MNRQTKEYLFHKAYDEYGSSMGRDEYGPSDNSKPYKLTSPTSGRTNHGRRSKNS